MSAVVVAALDVSASDLPGPCTVRLVCRLASRRPPRATSRAAST
jgi:hypothetical protein